MTDALPARTYEIGHFECEPDDLRPGKRVRYIVCEVVKDTHYILHLDSTCVTHQGVKKASEDLHPEYRGAQVIGGGQLALSNGKEPGTFKLRLAGESGQYRMEPPHIRAAFTPIVVAKLREMGMNIEDDDPQN